MTSSDVPSDAESAPDGLPADRAPAGLPPVRFATELVAWITAPIALWPVSPILSVLSVVVLIGLPAVFATPGDKNQIVVPVPGSVTIALVLLQIVVAVVAAWFVFPGWVTVLVWLIAATTIVTEQPRWRWLRTH